MDLIHSDVNLASKMDGYHMVVRAAICSFEESAIVLPFLKKVGDCGNERKVVPKNNRTRWPELDIAIDIQLEEGLISIFR